MFQLDYKDHRPLYEQIKLKIKELIIGSVLKPHDKIPSVRELAQILTINPNTIQKAYKDLEAEGFIYSLRAKGNFVSPLSESISLSRTKELTRELSGLLSELYFLQYPKEQIISLIDVIYEKKGAGQID